CRFRGDVERLRGKTPREISQHRNRFPLRCHKLLMRGFRRFRTSRAWVATQSGGNWWKGGRARWVQRDKRGETTYCHAGRTFDRTFCAKGCGPVAFVRRLG